MANPQLENGFVRIATEIVCAMAQSNFSKQESSFLWALFLKTYGFKKKNDKIPSSQITALTGIHKYHVSNTKKKLLDKKVIVCTNGKIAFNKNYEQWIGVTRMGNWQLPEWVLKNTRTGNQKLPKQVDSIDTTINTAIDPPTPRFAGGGGGEEKKKKAELVNSYFQGNDWIAEYADGEVVVVKDKLLEMKKENGKN